MGERGVAHTGTGLGYAAGMVWYDGDSSLGASQRLVWARFKY